MQPIPSWQMFALVHQGFYIRGLAFMTLVYVQGGQRGTPEIVMSTTYPKRQTNITRWRHLFWLKIKPEDL
jgi:hypothetical protein